MKSQRISGFSAERELVRKLWKAGFASIRAPASGAKVKRSVYPDVVAIKQGAVLVFEVKRRKKLSTIYIPKHQIEKLLEFARRAGAKPFIAVKIVELGEWRFVPVDQLEDVGDKLKLSKEVIERGLTFNDIVRLC